MARRSLKPEPSPRKRLIILSTIAAVGLIAVGITMIVQNGGEPTTEETTLEDSQPETGTGPDGALSSVSGTAKKGDKDKATTSKEIDANIAKSDPSAVGVPMFNNYDKNDKEFPVTGGPATTDPKSKAEQKSGEQLLAEIANEGNRDKLLREALIAFQNSVSADATNESARYGLAYTKANIGISYYASPKTSDDASGDSLMKQAVTDGKKAMVLAGKADNSLVYDLAQALVVGVTNAQKQRAARLKSK